MKTILLLLLSLCTLEGCSDTTSSSDHYIPLEPLPFQKRVRKAAIQNEVQQCQQELKTLEKEHQAILHDNSL